jgi:transcriptional regulator with AAA-type ATPase domain
MPAKQELSSFIRSTFRSVWSLELLCHLRKNRDRAWTQPDLVRTLRGSDLVVSHSVESLMAAGLIVAEADGTVRYQPVSESVDALAEAAEELYARRPDAVRRIIVVPAPAPGVVGFADAFKLRRD